MEWWTCPDDRLAILGTSRADARGRHRRCQQNSPIWAQQCAHRRRARLV